MREPPHLHEEAIRAAVQTHYNIDVAELTFLPIGHDSLAWVFRLEAVGGSVYFLKVKKKAVSESSLLVPRSLYEQGVTQVLAPLPTTEEALWVSLSDFTLILYPFIEGRTGMEAGLTDRQWIEFGALVKQIHTAPLASDLLETVRHEAFTLSASKLVRDVQTRIAAHDFADPSEQELAAFWQAHQAEISTLVERAEILGEQLRQTAPAFVLCHADLHTGNVMVDTDQRLWIVDWDEVIFAPKERDLMFVVGGISAKLIGPREEALFFQGYGPTVIDPLALAYYRYTWAVQDIGEYGAEAFLRSDLGPISRRAGAQSFMSLFQPGEIVALASATDPTAPLSK